MNEQIQAGVSSRNVNPEYRLWLLAITRLFRFQSPRNRKTSIIESIAFILIALLSIAGRALAQDYNSWNIDYDGWAVWDLETAETQVDQEWNFTTQYQTCSTTGWAFTGSSYNHIESETTYYFTTNVNCNIGPTPGGPVTVAQKICDPNTFWYPFYSSGGGSFLECVGGYYLAVPNPTPANGSCDCSTGKVSVGEPINPGSGNESVSEVDYASADLRLELARTFNSTDPTTNLLSKGWQTNLTSRRILQEGQMLAAPPSTATGPYYWDSFPYSDPQDACMNGATDIASSNSVYIGLSAVQYNPSTNQCLMSNGQLWPVYGAGHLNDAWGSPTSSALLAAQRPDGSVIYFTCTYGKCVATDGTASVHLTASSIGFTLVDTNGAVESYSTAGALNSIAAVGGYTQTFGYNSYGLLSGVTDSLGRSLTLSYNPSNFTQLQSVTTPDGSVNYGYDQANRLTSVSYLDASNNLLGSKTYQYNDPKNYYSLTGIIDENQQQYLSVAYDPTTAYATASSLGGLGVQALSINYMSAPADVADPIVTDAMGTSRYYHYSTINGRSRLLSIASANGQSAPCNSCGAPQAESFDTAGYLSSQTDWNGNVTNYLYDDSHGLEILRTEAANDTSAAPATRTIATTWNTTFREPTEIDEYSGGSTGGEPSGTELRTTKFGLDGSGNITSKTITDDTIGKSRAWNYQNYTSWGAPQTIIGPRTDVPDTTQITYYTGANASCTGSGCVATTCTASNCAVGQIYTITNPLGEKATFGNYDGSGRLLSIIDANGVQTTLSYTARGWLNSMIAGSNQAGGGRTTVFKYWPTGQIQEVDFPSGAVRSFFFNAAHQLTDIYNLPVVPGIAPALPTPPTGADHIHYTVDVMNNITGITVSDSTNTPVQVHTRDFNPLNQLWHDYGALSTETTTYSTYNDSQLKQISDPLGHLTNFSLDALNRVNAVINPDQASSNYSKKATTTYNRNTLDQITSVVDPRGLSTGYTVDALNDVLSIASPDTETTQQTTFDGDGNVTTRIDADGNTRISQYDALDRPTSIKVYAPSTTPGVLGTLTDTITLTWDQSDLCGQTGAVHGCGIGHLTEVTDSESSTMLSWTYNPWGQVIQKQETVEGRTLTTQWAYANTTGLLSKMTLPSAAVIGYGWGNGIQAGLVTSMSLNGKALISNIGYFPFKGPTEWTLTQEGNLVDNRSYDQDGRIDSDPVESIGYDAASRVNGWTLASKTGSGQVQYGYQNPMDWVSSYSDGTTTVNYQYDPNGNRSGANSVASGGTTTTTTFTVAAASNRLSSTKVGTKSTAYQYDNDGSRTKAGTTTYGYDNREQLTTIGTHAYAFDGLGERVYKKAPAVTLFNYDNSGQMIGEYTAAGKATEETIYLGAMPVATLIAGSAKTGTLYYIHADYRNTPRQIDNLAGTPVWAWTPQPYGENQPNSNPAGVGAFTYNLRYPGQYYDFESGLTYNIHRTYDSATGRYLQSDPIGLAAGINTYGYVHGNPLRHTDLRGLIEDDTGIDEAIVDSVEADAITNLMIEAEGGGAVAATAQISATEAEAFAEAYGEESVLPGEISEPFPGRPQQDEIYDAYLGYKNGQPSYVGISSRLSCRTMEHGDRFDAYEKLTDTPVTKDQARGIEQALINNNPDFENEINSISPDRDWYDDAVNYGNDFLKKMGL